MTPPESEDVGVCGNAWRSHYGFSFSLLRAPPWVNQYPCVPQDDTSRGAPWLTLEVDGRVGLAALQHVFRVMPSLGYAALICSAQLPSSSQSGLAVSFQEGRCGALAFKRLLLDTAGRQQASMGGFFLTLTKIRRASFARSHSASHVCIGHSPVRLPQTGLDRTIEWSLRQRA
ncbi:uncharacterized protein LOC115892641 isoform X3 [Rhinopithecus roxellana]|uniref:uncharacterized protein LOC115892641 isoform X3 n=1 Tax=Rhinopithecus roxellana TaxID=61622 RepID=UPI0012375D83|nr:uncharacterized protein LOC115892641 isoform X3 [Rhinopithecus roxellana]